MLTRQGPASLFRTVVIDLRAIGADIRIEDLRDCMLAPFMRRLAINLDLLKFLVNLAEVDGDFLLDAQVDTITVLNADERLPVSQSTATSSSERPATVAPDASGRAGNMARSTTPSGVDRWNRAQTLDQRVYRPLRPPTPPIPEGDVADVAATDLAFGQGLTFTVFDIYNNKRTLPRKPGQHVLELVEVALSLTPQIRRPWNYRIQEHVWEDLPTPQIVVWGDLELASVSYL